MAPIVLRRSGIVIPILMTTLVSGSSAANEDLGSQVSKIYDRYCGNCHSNPDSDRPQFNLTDRDKLEARRKSGSPLVVPGKPEDSLLWQRLRIKGDMPPKGNDKPSLEEKDLIKRWIVTLKSVPAPPATAKAEVKVQAPIRKMLLERDAMTAMIRFLEKRPEEDRRHYRFFTLTVPYNRELLARADRKPPALSVYRAALSKAVNSLSLEPDIVQPEPIDDDKTVYAIDLRDYGWEKDPTWQKVLETYPFGLKPKESEALEIRENLKRLVGGEDLPYVRADWFIANASQPPLYYRMLRLPDTVKEFEEGLGVNSTDNFLKGKVARAGFHESKISPQNRLIERHRTRQGAYWRSYDFKPKGDDGNIFVKPLGPTFEGNPYADQAFVHDGSEIIFSLPNGLQGYYLADGDGKRIERAPAEIVNAPGLIEEDSRVVAGISCIACHKEGMNGVIASEGSKAIRDELRERFPVSGDTRKLVERRHPRPEDLNVLLERDRERFMEALKKATKDFPGNTSSDQEVILEVARNYARRLDLEDILIELGYGREPRHKDEVRAILSEMALADPITRRDWQAPSGDFGQSPFQATAARLELGVPLNNFLGVR